MPFPHFDATANLLALGDSKRTIAALDHLWGRESILPLPQPALFSVAEIILRDLVVTTQDVDRVQHLWKQAGQKTWEWLVLTSVRRKRPIPAACGVTATIIRELYINSLQVPSSCAVPGRLKIAPVYHF